MHVYKVPEILEGDWYHVAEALLWVEGFFPKDSYCFEHEEGADPMDSLPIAFHVADISAIITIREIIEV